MLIWYLSYRKLCPRETCLDISRHFPAIKLLLERQQDHFFLQKWNNGTALSKVKIYAIFKENFTLENYFLLLSGHLWTKIFKFRTSNHHLQIEIGRWNNILVQDRICPLCNINDIGDKFHYLFICEVLFTEHRKKLLKPYYYNKPSTIKFKELTTTNKIGLLKKTSKFIKQIIYKFKIM